MEEKAKPKKTSEAFVSYITQKLEWDRAFAAKLRRADNPNLEHYAWEIIMPWCHSTDDSHRKILGLVAASMARCRTVSDGGVQLGTAIARVDKFNDNGHSVRLKKLLSCHDSIELCYHLRPLIRLIEANKIRLNYEKLLDQLLFFDAYPDRQKTKWARDCYRSRFSE